MRGNVRHLPFAVADGPANMAADEAMLVAAAEGTASLRFYGWSPATLSLGYFQSASVRNGDPRFAPLPYVRRATGGGTLIHDRELTYALALPAGLPWQSAAPWMPRFHDTIRAALAGLGLGDAVRLAAAEEVLGKALCFHKQTVGDILCRGQKIVGSAQRKQRRCLLQHGSILLRQSRWASEVPGIFELTGVDLSPDAVREAVLRQFAESTEWTIETGVWSDAETRLIATLVREKFANASWNDKR
jgi:lipoate-protein ligase A